MPPKAIICDWNGTLIEYRDERPILESIAVDIFKASVPFHPKRMARILKAKKELESLHSAIYNEDGLDFVTEIFKVYNGKIIKDIPVSIIHRAVERYARKQKTRNRLDYKILRPVNKAHEEGKTTGIFSAGYGYGIETILKAVDYYQIFDFYEADKLKYSDGRAIEIGRNIYKRKAELLPNLLEKQNLKASITAYIGDNKDDEGCFEIVKYPIVSFAAPDEQKELCARKYKAFVPKDEMDLQKYFDSA
jgi:hydroxymethylpyrimidine pyrophosphatase-like HAD family hydrolase